MIAQGVTNVDLWFMQLGTKSATPEDVAANLGQTPAPVLADDKDMSIWTGFDADWYEAVLIDADGCLVDHFGPFSDEPPEEEITIRWTAAALGNLGCENPESLEPASDLTVPSDSGD